MPKGTSSQHSEGPNFGLSVEGSSALWSVGDQAQWLCHRKGIWGLSCGFPRAYVHTCQLSHPSTCTLLAEVRLQQNVTQFHGA